MEPLEATLMDELLRDFSGDAVPPTPPSLRRHRVPGAPPPDTVFSEEEDLEWLSNKDAFPTLDTFDISAPSKPSPPLAAGAAPKRPSPVSVLDGGLPHGGQAAPLFLQRAPGRARSEGRGRRSWRALPVVLPPAVEPACREKRRCWHCDAEETPQWRAGPGGPKTLCNACGVRYKSGRLVPEYRPASSPSFSGELHSNSHRKIMEMRRMKEGRLPPVAAAAAAAATTKGWTKKKRKKRKKGSSSLPI